MSKAQRWRALGRRWQLPGGQLVTSPFPGAQTVQDIGRQVRRNKRNRLRWTLATLPEPRRQAFRQVLATLRRRCMGREFTRRLWAAPTSARWRAAQLALASIPPAPAPSRARSRWPQVRVVRVVGNKHGDRLEYF